MRNLTFPRTGMQSPFSWHQKSLGALLMLCMYVGFTTDTNAQNSSDANGAIGNYVWIDENADGLQDVGEPGLAGVAITIINPADGTILTTVTDTDGAYLFDNLVAGKYDVHVNAATLPEGLSQTTNPILPGADFGNQTQAGNGYSITIADGEENLTADFGYVWGNPNGNQGEGAIGNRIWYDANSNGVQDPGEAGIGGITVGIYEDADGDGIIDDPVTLAIDQNGSTGVGITVTEPDGSYIFYNLPAGAYAIVVDTNSPPLAGLFQTGDPDDYAAPATNPDNMGEAVILAPGDVFLLMDFGYYDPNANDIGDTVYFDPNANGTQDPGELGIEGVTVKLSDQNGDVIATTTTDENGEYLFSGLPNAPYIVMVTDTDNVLGNLVNSGDPDGGNDEMSFVASLSADNFDQDFGYTPAGHYPGDGLIGGIIFIDYDSSGSLDTGEGVEGVTVDLHDDTGTVISSTVTNENGNYYFPGLDPNTTYSTTVDPNTLPPGLVQTVDPDGTLDDSSTTDLSQDADGIDLTLDYGYQPNPGSTGAIGGLIWLDNNADGINDFPFGPDGILNTDDDEPGIEGITIDLYEDANDNSVVDPGEPLVANTITNTNGNYLFLNLPTNNLAGVNYIVDITDKANVIEGYWHSLGVPYVSNHSQIDPYVTRLGGGNPVNNLTVDFGYYVEPAKVGNRVWFDYTLYDSNPLSRNGIQDPGELGIPGILVEMEIDYPDGSRVNLATTTDANGFYCFGNLLFDEDYRASGGVGEPIYTLTTNPFPGVFLDRDLAPTITQAVGASPLEDSEAYWGTNAIACQGWTDVTLALNPTDETPWASYDFGFIPGNFDEIPVELVTFKGIEDDCRAVLTWMTATESNVSHFSVEQSTNGNDFSILGRVDAAGESQVERTYTYTDKQLTANNYYRLHIVDFDGSSEYSDIILVNAGCASGVFVSDVSVSNISPNPARNVLNIRVNSSLDEETAKIVVTDNIGRTVLTKATEVFFGTNIIQLDVKNLPQATYHISIEGENGRFSQSVPFVKVK